MNIKTLTAAAMLVTSPSASHAQAENGFQEIDVMQHFDVNPFLFYTQPLILCAGDRQTSNAMTIGWGALGNIWGMNRPTATVFVAPKRYTHEFMERCRYFTIMHFADDHINEYLGQHSGRDGDKAQALGLHLAYTEHGTPYYKEADLVIECEIMYAAPIQAEGFRNAVPQKMYARFPAGIHTQYMGEIVGAWTKRQERGATEGESQSR